MPLPDRSRELGFGAVTLRFSKVVPGESARGFVPYYHFRILRGSADTGHLNLRLGGTEHVRLAAGHIGFEIAEQYRGHRYALQACRALAPFAKSIQPEYLITCDPENLASLRTIELLGAELIDRAEVLLMTHITRADQE